jgi:hypothetical protein
MAWCLVKHRDNFILCHWSRILLQELIFLKVIVVLLSISGNELTGATGAHSGSGFPSTGIGGRRNKKKKKSFPSFHC